MSFRQRKKERAAELENAVTSLSSEVNQLKIVKEEKRKLEVLLAAALVGIRLRIAGIFCALTDASSVDQEFSLCVLLCLLS